MLFFTDKNTHTIEIIVTLVDKDTVLSATIIQPNSVIITSDIIFS